MLIPNHIFLESPSVFFQCFVLWILRPLPCCRPCASLLFLSHTLCCMGFQTGPMSAQWERWGARNGKTKGTARDWGEAVQICKTTQKTSPPPWIMSPRKPLGGQELSAMRLCIPHCCSWATQLQCGKGLSSLEKALPHQHCVKPPAFHLSSDWRGIRRGKGKDDMKRMWLQYLTQRPQHVSNVPMLYFSQNFISKSLPLNAFLKTQYT